MLDVRGGVQVKSCGQLKQALADTHIVKVKAVSSRCSNLKGVRRTPETWQGKGTDEG